MNPHARDPLEEVGMARSYPPEFRARVLDLSAAGRSVVSVATDPGVSGLDDRQLAAQDQIDRGEKP